MDLIQIEQFIADYGYFAVFLGTFLEGETILAIGGFAAQRGYLSIGWVIVVAFLGSFCGDQFFFFMGRFQSGWILRRWPSLKTKVERVRRILERHMTLVIFGFRFLYGLRTVAPFALGMTKAVPSRRFFSINVIGAIVWSVMVGAGGYLFGSALEVLIEDIKRYEKILMLGIALIGMAYWLYHRYKKHKKKLAHKVTTQTGD